MEQEAIHILNEQTNQIHQQPTLENTEYLAKLWPSLGANSATQFIESTQPLISFGQF